MHKGFWWGGAEGKKKLEGFELKCEDDNNKKVDVQEVEWGMSWIAVV